MRGHLETAGMCQARRLGKKSALHRPLGIGRGHFLSLGALMCMTKGPRAAGPSVAQDGSALKCGRSIPRWSPASPGLRLVPHSRAWG